MCYGDADHGRRFAERNAAFLRFVGQGTRHSAGVTVAIGWAKRGSQHVVDYQLGDTLLRFCRAYQARGNTQGLLESDMTLHSLPALGCRNKKHVAVLVETWRL